MNNQSRAVIGRKNNERVIEHAIIVIAVMVRVGERVQHSPNRQSTAPIKSPYALVPVDPIKNLVGRSGGPRGERVIQKERVGLLGVIPDVGHCSVRHHWKDRVCVVTGRTNPAGAFPPGGMTGGPAGMPIVWLSCMIAYGGQ